MEQSDIPILPKSKKVSKYYQMFEKHFLKSDPKKSERRRLISCLFNSVKKDFIVAMITGFFYILASMSIPIIVSVAISTLQKPKVSTTQDLLIFGSLIVLKFLSNLLETHSYNLFQLIGLSIVNCLNLAILKKATRFPSLCSK